MIILKMNVYIYITQEPDKIDLFADGLTKRSLNQIT